MRKNFIIAVSGFLIVFTVGVMLIYRQISDISTLPEVKQAAVRHISKPVVYFGVISRYSPNLIYNGYQPIMDYLSSVTPYRFELRLSRNYAQTIKQLSNGRVAAAFLGTYVYVKFRRMHHLRCILKPLNNHGRPYFHSMLISTKDGPVDNPRQLSGKRVALPSELSFSANWFTRILLPSYGIAKNELTEIRHFNHHNTVIYQLLNHSFDAGVVKERVAQEFLNSGLQILAQSPPVPASPVVICDKTPPAVQEAIVSALLKIDLKQQKYRQMVQSWDAEFQHGFVPAKDSDYNVVLPMLSKEGRLP